MFSENGEEHNDHTVVGTLSVFGYQTRFDLRETFPLLTTKKVPFRLPPEFPPIPECNKRPNTFRLP